MCFFFWDNNCLRKRFWLRALLQLWELLVLSSAMAPVIQTEEWMLGILNQYVWEETRYGLPCFFCAGSTAGSTKQYEQWEQLKNHIHRQHKVVFFFYHMLINTQFNRVNSRREVGEKPLASACAWKKKTHNGSLTNSQKMHFRCPVISLQHHASDNTSRRNAKDWWQQRNTKGSRPTANASPSSFVALAMRGYARQPPASICRASMDWTETLSEIGSWSRIWAHPLWNTPQNLELGKRLKGSRDKGLCLQLCCFFVKLLWGTCKVTCQQSHCNK